MDIASLNDKKQIERYLRRFQHVNYYHLGDLDDFFWPHTEWFARLKEGEIRALTLLYTAPELPVLLAILNENREEMNILLNNQLPTLPDAVYAHLSPGLDQLFQKEYDLSHNGEHYKMLLSHPEKLAQFKSSKVFRLTPDHLPEIEALYHIAYPGNWFNSRMLDSGQYLGTRSSDGELICVAGVHVFSPEYRVAALGNITTHPKHRNQGLATTATAALCTQVLDHADLIGLNVRTDNLAAIKTYQKIGFEIVARYHEWNMERRITN